METQPTLEKIQLLRSREAAELLAVSIAQFDRLVERGLLHPIRLTENGHRRFRASDIAALIDNHEED